MKFRLICLFFCIIILVILIKKKNAEKFEDLSVNKKRTLYVVTPSIGRDNLVRTCISINKQKFKNWKHIILFDKTNDTKIKRLLEKIPYKPIVKKGFWNNYGNGQRYEAWEMVENDYDLMTYIDDDDFYKSDDAFSKIISKFSKNSDLEAVFYAGIREGKYYNNKPPRLNHTMSNQYAHLKYKKNKTPIRWPKINKNDQIYRYDGEFVDEIVKKCNYDYIDGKALVEVPKSNYGKLKEK